MLKYVAPDSEKSLKSQNNCLKTQIITIDGKPFDDDNLANFENKIGYKFKNKSFLQTALTHKSCSPDRKSYDRLEFLGDSILGFIIAEHLYLASGKNEGALTGEKQRLVSTEPLADASRRICADKYIAITAELYKNKVFASGAPNSLCEDVYEALVAAIYLDGGIEESKLFIERTLLINEKEALKTRNVIAILQEYAQARKLGTPVYELVSEDGPPHAPIFTMAVTIGGKQIATGSGTTKKLADKQAAENALKKIKERKE